MGTPFDADRHLGVTELFFERPDRLGPIPFAPSLVDIDRLSRSMRGSMWTAISGEIRRGHPGARYYPEKVVGDAELLLDTSIPLRLIDLVRDPRDVFCSIRTFSRGGPGFGRTAGQGDDAFADKMAGAQRRRLDAMARTPAGVDRVLLRYEDLVKDLSGHADRLSDWLGVALDVARVEAARDRYRHHMTTRSTSDSVGRSRRELEPHLARRIREMLGSRIEQLSYLPT